MFTFVLAPTLNAQCVDCPACGTEAAIGFLKKTSNSKTVYEVKQKEIAVPNICLPRPLFNFQEQFRNLRAPKCCPGKPCGCPTGDCPKRVREGEIKVVKVLSKKKVKCDACAYEWEVADIEDVNEYLYDIEPASDAKVPTEATPVAPAAPAKEADSEPVEVEELPLMEVPAAPKMGWQDRPLFQLKKKSQPVSFAPQPFLNAQPAAISSQPIITTAQPTITAPPTAFNPTAFNPPASTTITTQPAATITTPPAPIDAPPTKLKALPASTSDAFIIRKPGPQN